MLVKNNNYNQIFTFSVRNVNGSCPNATMSGVSGLFYMDAIRSVTVHVFVPNIFGKGLSVQYTCLQHCFNQTARVKLHWTLPVLYIATFDKNKVSPFNCQFLSGNSNNKYLFDAL